MLVQKLKSSSLGQIAKKYLPHEAKKFILKTLGSVNQTISVPEVPLDLPERLSREEILNYFLSFRYNGATHADFAEYATSDCNRFLLTLSLAPKIENLKCLEIGAHPYFTTQLLKKFRNYDVSITNYFGGETKEQSDFLKYTDFDGKTQSSEMKYLNINCEGQKLPYEDESFDVILFCEILEHLTLDPAQCLSELGRVLKKGGALILTTPNVARLENVSRMIRGINIYDPYSGYGLYGRHNREYSAAELKAFMPALGYTCKKIFTADVHGNMASSIFQLNKISTELNERKEDLGQYIFSSWIKNQDIKLVRPSWLYRSYPTDQIYPQIV